MKKYIIALYCVILSFAFVACGEQQKDEINPKQESVQEPAITSEIEVIEESVAPPVIENTMYLWEDNDVFARFYSEYHSTTGAKEWEHMGINGSTYYTPNSDIPDWFDIYTVHFTNGSTKYYAIAYGQIQMTDVYEIQADNSLICVWSIPLEEHHTWMKTVDEGTNEEYEDAEFSTGAKVELTAGIYNEKLSELLQSYKYQGYTVLQSDGGFVSDEHPYRYVVENSNYSFWASGNPVGDRYIFGQDEQITMMYQDISFSYDYLNVNELILSLSADIGGFDKLLDVEPEIIEINQKHLVWCLDDVVFVVETLGGEDWKANRVLNYSFVVLGN